MSQKILIPNIEEVRLNVCAIYDTRERKERHNEFHAEAPKIVCYIKASTHRGEPMAIPGAYDIDHNTTYYVYTIYSQTIAHS